MSAGLVELSRKALESFFSQSLQSFKVLVFDARAKEVIAPIFTTSVLNDLGVALFVEVGSDRVRELSSFVSTDIMVILHASRASSGIERLSKVIRSCQVFVLVLGGSKSTLSEPLKALQDDGNNAVRVFTCDGLDFVPIASDFFVAPRGVAQETLKVLAGRGGSSDVAEEIAKTIRSSMELLGVFPEQIILEKGARGLESDVFDSLMPLLRGANPITRRPIQLMIVGRTFQIPPLCWHSWSYCNMLTEVLPLENSMRVRLDDGGFHELDTEGDFIWRDCRRKDLPLVTERISKELKLIMANRANLQMAAENVKKKKVLDFHYKVSERIMKWVASDRINDLIEIEQEVLLGRDSSAVKKLEAIASGLQGESEEGPNALELLRTLLFYLAVSDDPQPMSGLMEALDRRFSAAYGHSIKDTLLGGVLLGKGVRREGVDERKKVERRFFGGSTESRLKELYKNHSIAFQLERYLKSESKDRYSIHRMTRVAGDPGRPSGSILLFVVGPITYEEYSIVKSLEEGARVDRIFVGATQVVSQRQLLEKRV